MIQRAAILSTGDELTTGRTLDTNANYIADKLVGLGLEVAAVIVVGDFPDRIAWAWRETMRQADVVISTGGLGPTADDLTTQTVGDVVGRPLRLDQEVADRIGKMFAAIGRQMPENNLRQAMFPEGAVVIPNGLGTAPGYRLSIDAAEECGSKHLVVLPGVPREMKPMLEQEVLPWLQSQRGSDDVYVSRVFQTFGISESALDEQVSQCLRADECRIAFRAAFPQVSVRLTVQGKPDEAPARLDQLSQRLRDHLGEVIYGEGDTSMEAEVGALLKARGCTLALAESCTGGLVANRLTNIAGSSAYLRGGVVAYSNDVKQSQLGVRPETLAAHGAVSEETAVEMATAARKLLGADLGLAITGIAGPDGGSAEKPVGTVCFALASAGRTFHRRYQLWGTRDWIKLLSSQVGLDWIRRYLLGFDPTQANILRK
ncbi:MAG TPA: competence/damage-inducible protein A [Terriglobales bacterium]|nr:competence/damage-inducible protein A [Terriglobales bacterium]